MSQSCFNNYAVSQALMASGMCAGQWTMVLVESGYQFDCVRLVTRQHISEKSVIACAEFAVSVDQENACVQLAQDAIPFHNAAHRFKDVGGAVLITTTNVAIAFLGMELINNLFRHTDSGPDLILRPGADKAIFGL